MNVTVLLLALTSAPILLGQAASVAGEPSSGGAPLRGRMSSGGRVFMRPPNAMLGETAATAIRKTVLELNQGRLAPLGEASWEHRIFRASIKTSQLLHLNIEGEAGHYVIPSASGDVLITKLNATLPWMAEKSEIWLRDAPSSVTYIIKADSRLLAEPRLKHFCEQLFRWDDLALISISLSRESVANGGEFIGGLVDHLKTSTGSFYVKFAALGEADVAYFLITISKDPRDYPLGGAMVAERFPPLSERVKALTRSQIAAELDRETPDSHLRFEYRDTIVFTELLRRGPVSAPEIEEYLLRDTMPPLNWLSVGTVSPRLRALLSAARACERSAEITTTLAYLMLRTDMSDNASNFLAAELFRQAEGKGTLGGTALLFLSKHPMNTLPSGRWRTGGFD